MTDRRLTKEEGWRARQLWGLGYDTAQIAHELGVSEATVANSLPFPSAVPFPLRESATPTQQETDQCSASKS